LAAIRLYRNLITLLCPTEETSMKLASAKALAIAALALTSSLAVLPALSLAEQQTLTQTDTAIIEMKVGKIGFLIGVSRGDGRVFYNGREAGLDVNGLRVGLTIGASFRQYAW
jgi:hypothetical protein